MELHADLTCIVCCTAHEGTLNAAAAGVAAGDGPREFRAATGHDLAHGAGIGVAVQARDGRRTGAGGEIPGLAIVAEGDIGGRHVHNVRCYMA